MNRFVVYFLFMSGVVFGGIVNRETYGLQLFPKVVDVGGDKYMVVWEDTRNESIEIYAQLIDGEGNPQWNEDKLLSQDGTREFIGHRMVSRVVGSGSGAIIGFINYYGISGVSKGINATKITRTGSRWSPDTVVNITSTVTEDYALCEDGHGGAVFVWVEKKGSEYYLKARHLDADGGDVWNNPGWEDPHVAVLHTAFYTLKPYLYLNKNFDKVKIFSNILKRRII